MPEHSGFAYVRKVIRTFIWAASITYEPSHDKTNKMACSPSEDSDQPGHPPSIRCELSG